MKIVITGGNGYLGARLSLYFAKNGHDVFPVCYPDKPKDTTWENMMSEIIVGDIRIEKTIVSISNIQPDVIIHLISLDHFESEKEPSFVNDVNVLPTWRLLDACTKKGLNKFVYFSTVQVYGKLNNTVIEEDYPTNTTNIYGLTHYLSETICDHFNRNTLTNVIIARLANSYGDPIFIENNCWWLAINDLCKSAFTKREIRLLSDGKPQRDFIHGNDVCNAINTLIHYSDKSENNKYHISSGNTVTIGELAILIKDEYRRRYNTVIPIFTPNGELTNNSIGFIENKYKISNERISSLGFSLEYSISKGINELFDYFEINPDI